MAKLREKKQTTAGVAECMAINGTTGTVVYTIGDTQDMMKTAFWDELPNAEKENG